MNRLRELRKNHGLTLKELGKKVSMHDNTLKPIRDGKTKS